MCLDALDKRKITDKIKATVPEEGIIVYKVVEIKKEKKYSPVYQYHYIPFVEGINKAITTMEIGRSRDLYQAGYHCWLTRKIAKKYLKRLIKVWGAGEYRIIECKVKKEWITTTGMQGIDDGSKKYRVIVTEKAIFPAYKEQE